MVCRSWKTNVVKILELSKRSLEVEAFDGDQVFVFYKMIRTRTETIQNVICGYVQDACFRR